MSIKPFSPPIEYSFDELKRRLEILKQHKELPIFGKKRNSALGESLEKYLGLMKNSSKSADWGDYEIKTVSNINRKFRLFSLNWEFIEDNSARNLVLEYGKQHFSNHLQKPVIRLDWKIPFSKNPINQLHYMTNKKNEFVLLFKDKILAVKNIDNLEKHFTQKMKKLVIIETATIKDKRNPAFQIRNAILYENTSFERFLFAIKNNMVELSFALMLIEPDSLNEKFNNRGSSLKISIKKLNYLYDGISKIC